MRGPRRVAVLTMVLVSLQSACSAPAPSTSPTGSPAATSASTPTIAPTSAQQTPVVSATEAPVESPAESLPPEEPAAPAAADLIQADLQASVIDEPTAILYRLYATVADDRLPEKYRGSASEEDDAAYDAAAIGYATFPVDVQDAVRPFIVRPTSPESYWAAPPSSVGSGRLFAAAGPLLAPATPCENGWVERTTVHVRALVWGQCGQRRSDAEVEARVNEIATYIDELWTPMTALMGDPIGDEEDPSDPNDNYIEANDGLLDIYLVENLTTLHGRYLDTPVAGGVAEPAYPFDRADPASPSSTFIVLKTWATGIVLKAGVAHEFFHSLQAAHNRFGVDIGGLKNHWFVEASAKWAEYQFVPEARVDRAYTRYYEFARTDQSLSSNVPFENAYRSFTWPLFMAQEAQPEAVASAWRAFEHKKGMGPLQGALDGVLPFKTHFRDFAVRVWDEALDPGDPIDRWQEHGDPDFPLHHPPFPRLDVKEDVHAQGPNDPPRSVGVVIASLWADYADLTIDDDVGQLIFDFSGITPASALDVDLLIKVEDHDWERQPVTESTVRFCRDKPDEKVEQVIVVKSNHDLDLSHYLTGSWTFQGLKAACADLSGTLTITRVSVYNNAQGEPMWTRDEDLTATILVDMESDPDPFGGGGYIDFGSKFAIERTTLDRRQMGDCTASYGTKSSGSWLFTDQPVGADWENNISGYVDRTNGIVQLSVVVHYPYQTTEDVCNLVSPSNEGVHDFFACTRPDGMSFLTGTITEVEDGPDTVDFSCTQEGRAMDYTNQKIVVSGTLTLNDEAAPPPL